MKGDRFKIMKDGQCVGHGFGYTMLAEGETLEELDTEVEMLTDADVHKQLCERDCLNKVASAKSEDRNQAFTTKAFVFRQFLANVPDTGETGEDALPLIDQVIYEELYDEYSDTHHLLDGRSPWDLCRLVKSKATKLSKKEAKRRVAILENEKMLAEISNDQ